MDDKNSTNSSFVELTKDEIMRIRNISLQLLHINPLDEPELFCEKAKYLSKQIPLRIQDIFIHFLLKGNSTGFLLIRGLSLSEIETNFPKTPSKNNESIGSTTLLSRIQSIFMSILGEMISYEAEGNGFLFQDLVPVKNMEIKQTSYSSDVELEIHTEQAFSTVRPDFLSLACIRGDEKATTFILPVEKILENISNEEYTMLCKPLWKIGVDVSFKINGHEFIEGNIRGPIPIIGEKSKESTRNTLIFDQDLMHGIDEESNQLIQKIVEIYYRYRMSHSLESGDIIFIDNRYAVHGRSSFIAKYDGTDRFLIRCFATTDYEKTKYARITSKHTHAGRMIHAIYS